MKIPLNICRKQLATLWFVGSGLFLGLLAWQSLIDIYANDSAVWSWALPAVLPAVSLISGVCAADLYKPSSKRMADRFFFRFAWWLSVIYLLLLFQPILIQPFFLKTDPLVFFQKSGLWLGPIQGIVGAVLAAFFTRSN